jgi:hypothetical protein
MSTVAITSSIDLVAQIIAPASVGWERTPSKLALAANPSPTSVILDGTGGLAPPGMKHNSRANTRMGNSKARIPDARPCRSTPFQRDSDVTRNAVREIDDLELQLVTERL